MQLSAINAALGRFLAELQRRKVLRMAATYLVGAWIVLQVAVALQTAMSLSASFSAAILALLVIGFPVALVVSWFFEITPEGVRRTAPASGDLAPFKPQTTDLVLAGVLGLVIVFAVVQAVIPRDGTATSAATTTTAEAPKPKPEPPSLGDKSIAVLPFANLSPDKDDEYFANGLTEELLNLLAKIGDLKVISRTSSFAFKGKDTPLPEIAKQLGVRHIVEGSVRSRGRKPACDGTVDRRRERHESVVRDLRTQDRKHLRPAGRDCESCRGGAQYRGHAVERCSQSPDEKPGGL